ncbi:hypothetical protein [Litorilituus lipolyticus]|uniref:DUF4397 domain-containing protein n=1 Tax=Litorilituus lipolyticus TaxID=2491017 RepID=A0A502KWY1_9GAMM|nr:hypothetical protein [Litorilituus lipolyticus]TPH15594.1 hypothetical protein EPA86_08415 [Litorilituus lipolyticus]
MNKRTFKKLLQNSLTLISTFTLLACGSSSDDSGTGYVKLYNASSNAPSIYLTVDEDLNSTDDDHFEHSYSGVPFAQANSNYEIDSGTYSYQLAWQDDDSTASDNLSVLHESELTISNDSIEMIVLSDSILSPQIMTYSMPLIDDDNDDTEELFNLRVLNMHSSHTGIDFYLSKDDETFNEAQFVGDFSYQALSDNHKFEQSDYIFYITESGSNEVLFETNSISFAYSSQYIMVVRENKGAGSSPYILDKVSNSTVTEYTDADAEASFKTYNAVAPHEQLDNYQGDMSLFINGVDNSPEIAFLPYGEMSNDLIVASGDYSLDLSSVATSTPLLSNHLLSLTENSNKTVFFYAEEEYVDSDGDGNVDENGDGIIDEIEVNLFSLVVDNSLNETIYDHEIESVNLVQSDEFDQVTVYFVRSNETIDTALYYRTIHYKKTSPITLLNNTYQVFVIGEENDSRIILNTFELTLNEESREQFLIIENSTESTTGYKSTLIDQITPQVN